MAGPCGGLPGPPCAALALPPPHTSRVALCAQPLHAPCCSPSTHLQFCWGIYPAGVRYLQTEGNRPLSSLQLRQGWLLAAWEGPSRVLAVVFQSSDAPAPPCSFLINLMACPALFLGTTLPLWLLKRRSKKQEAQQAQEEHRDASGSGCAPAAPGGGVAANGQEHEPSALPLSDGDSLAEPLLQPSDLESGPPSAAEPPPSCGGGPTARQRALVLAATTSFLTILFLAQVFSLLFTTAYLSQMVGRLQGLRGRAGAQPAARQGSAAALPLL